MSVVAIFAAGILMGTRYRSAALVVATALLLLGSLVWNGLGFARVGVTSFLILAFALAGAYLLGLLLTARFGRKQG